MGSNNRYLTPLQQYVSYLQSQLNGGGTSIPTPSESGRKNRMLEQFKEIGWNENVLQTKFKNLTDDMLDGTKYRDDELILGFVELWFYEIELDTRIQIGFDTTIEKILQSMGLSVSASNNAEYAISPLYDTCYTNSQLVELAIEYLLGYNDPISDINSTHYYKPEIVDTWIPFSNE
jgi:hypothetical protein